MKTLVNYINEKKNEEVEDVYFGVDDENEEVTAFFPNQKNGKYIGCYAHIGQHSDASLEYAKECRPAKPEEYKDLYNELTKSVGYKLNVLKKL